MQTHVSPESQPTLRSLLPPLREALRRHYDGREADAIAERFVEDVCGWSRTDYLMRRDEPLPPPLAAAVAEGAARLAEGEPLQYVLGRADFLGQRFRVGPGVLIPRPETEELVRWIADDAADGAAAADDAATTPVAVLDVGTGSGCIALSLARLIHNAQAVAIDLSTAALAVAEENAKAQGVSNISFVRMDILRAAAGREGADYPPLCTAAGVPVDKFDVIVSNPPYVRLAEAAAMRRNVLAYEPREALFVPDDDPLLFYRAIARFGRRRLKPGGRLYCELNAALGRETADLFAAEGYAGITLRRDAEGRDRMLRAAAPPRPTPTEPT